MSLHRRAAKRDANEREIIDALLAVGCSCQQLSVKGVPDLLVGYHGQNYLMEVKGNKAKVTMDELNWHLLWDGQFAIVRSAAEALRVIGVE